MACAHDENAYCAKTKSEKTENVEIKKKLSHHCVSLDMESACDR